MVEEAKTLTATLDGNVITFTDFVREGDQVEIYRSFEDAERGTGWNQWAVVCRGEDGDWILKLKIEGAKRDEDFGPGYVPTEDEQMLLDRANAAHKFLRNHPGAAIPVEILEAVVWPSEEMLEAQRTGGAGLTSL